MSHEDTGCTGINVITQHQHDLFASVRIERTRRLVRKNDRAVTHESTGDRDALALTTGQELRETIRQVRNAHLLKRGHRSLTHLGGTHTIELQRHLNVFEGRQRGNQVVILEDVSNRPATNLGAMNAVQSRQVNPVDIDMPSGRTLQAAGDRQQRRFTGAGRTHNSEKLAGCDLKVDPVERSHSDAVSAELMSDASHPDR